MKDSKKVLDSQKMDWMEIVLLVKRPENIQIDRINRWLQKCSNIIILAEKSVDSTNFSDPVHLVKIDSDRGKSELWNEIISKSDAEWVLLLEDDEDFDFSDLELFDRSRMDNWMPAKIVNKCNDEPCRQFYQMRLIPALQEKVFEGKNLPDATAYITGNHIDLSNSSINIIRNSELLSGINIEEEMSVTDFSPLLYLYEGFKLLEERKPAYAAAHFRALLKREKLIAYDRLAAVNGLAGCFTEQYKWGKALALANESIEAESQQFLPYLIKFRIFQLNKQWVEALDVLMTYRELQVDPGFSRANFEKFINAEETVTHLADLAIRTGLRRDALQFYEELYSLKQAKNDNELLNILLVLSIELLDYERSVFYFKAIFEEFIPDKLCEEKARELNDFLTMFMVNGWFDYPSEVYDLLYEQESENGDYRRRLIVTLSKTNRLDRARQLIVQNM